LAQSRTDAVLRMVKDSGVLRPKDLDSHGIPREYLRRLRDRGLLIQAGRGLYVMSDSGFPEHLSLAEACKRVPHGVVCLLSALRFHDLGTQLPFQVWLAIDSKARRPRVDYPPLRIVRFSGHALSDGVEEHSIESATVRVFCPAKTVADCFKYRNKIGLDVALEALRECRRERKCSEADLWRYAGVCRVANVMRPYLEATACG
jgi:predicted transcriptional regulator of viral defense system